MANTREVDVMVNVYPVGLTIRDYFAAMALTGVVSSARGHHLDVPDVVDEAYRYADAMMERREGSLSEGDYDGLS